MANVLPVRTDAVHCVVSKLDAHATTTHAYGHFYAERFSMSRVLLHTNTEHRMFSTAVLQQISTVPRSNRAASAIPRFLTTAYY